MTREETLAVMTALKAAYPNFYKGMSPRDANDAVSLWGSMFDEPVELVLAAVKAVIAVDERGFAPSIGAVKGMVRKLTEPQQLTEAEAWAIITKAVRNAVYGSQQEFDRLPPLLQRLVGSPNQLRDWALMDAQTFQSVEGSNFRRSYTVRAKAQREYDALPEEIRQIAAITAEKIALEGGAPGAAAIPPAAEEEGSKT